MHHGSFAQVSGEQPSIVGSDFTDMVMGTGSNQEYLEAINRTIELTQMQGDDDYGINEALSTGTNQ